MNTVSLVLLLVLASLTCALKCPTDFVAISGSCYYFQVNEPPTNWQYARVRCQNLPLNETTDLAMVADCTQFQELFQYMYTHYPDVNFWIGGSDEETPDIWHWVNGELMPNGHPYWNPGDLDSYYHCAYISGTTGLFRSKDCTDDYTKYDLCQTYPQAV